MEIRDSSLIATKLHVPTLHSTHIARPNLVEHLERGLSGKLILVAATAGFGKTSLVAEWWQQHINEISWLSLDQTDNEPTRFCAYLVAALQTNRSQFGQQMLPRLQLTQTAITDAILGQIVNELAALSQRLILVLDDYHVINNTAVHAILAFLLDHLPSHVTFVLITRSDPPLALAKLRAEHTLLEIRAADLRFSIEESAQLLNQVIKLNLPETEVEALERRTEGWVVGLQLAALAIQTFSGDIHTFIQGFTGSHRFILDYLVEEILNQQPTAVQQFLRQTAILQRFNASLCRAVTGNENSQVMLDYLDRNNLFVLPLDQSRQWYRYHHLFAEMLQARLQTEPFDERQVLYSRAANWHTQNNLPEEAVSYALAGHAFDFAAELITGPAAGVMQRGEVFTLLKWYRAFPTEIVTQHPQLGLQFGLAFALNGRWAEAETLLSLAESNVDTTDQERMLLTYLVGSYRQDARRLNFVADSSTDQPMSLVARALLSSLADDFHTANTLLTEAQRRSEQVGNTALALTALFHQCRFYVYLGDLKRGYEVSQLALTKSDGLPLACFAYTALGRIMIEWNELEAANRYLSHAIRLSELTGFVTGVLSSATMMLAEVKEAQGDTAAANKLAQIALSNAERYDPPAEVTWLKTYQVRLWLVQGNKIAAGQWLHSVKPEMLPHSMFYPTSVVAITQARILLAHRQINRAITLVTPLLTVPATLFRVEALAVLSLARHLNGDNINAFLTLKQALTAAEAENRLRALLDLGQPLATLLARFCESHPTHRYAQAVLSLFKTQPELSAPEAGIERLTPREREVLQLIVAGYSNDEIAQTLVVAISTVKWYVNVLFGKLHVSTRAQAIARTYSLKLLD